MEYAQADCCFLVEPSCSCLIFNDKKNQPPRRLKHWFQPSSNCRRLLWLLPRVGSALTVAHASVR